MELKIESLEGVKVERGVVCLQWFVEDILYSKFCATTNQPHQQKAE
jgi:hypothetical protein